MAFKKLAFHENGKPRGWLRFILGFDKQRNATGPLRFVAVNRAGEPRPPFAPWVNRVFKMRAPESLVKWLSERDAIIENGALSSVKTLTILASPHTLFIARLLVSCLEGSRLSVNVRSEYRQDDSDLYLVIAPQYFEGLPPLHKSILFQVEQSTTDRWFTDEYLNLLQGGLAIFDYSLKNISFMREKNIPLKSTYYIPLAPLPENKHPAEKDIEVLFYGDASMPRRTRYIERLRESFKVEVVTNIFGDEMRKKIRRAKVVVNIHAYEDALLETTRLCEVISEGTRVVSEAAIDQNSYTQFDGIVTFVPVGEIEEMVSAVAEALRKKDKIQENTTAYYHTKFMVLRSFLGLGVLSPDEFLSLTSWYKLPSDRLILSLPEETDRYSWCQQNSLKGYTIFPGLRRQPGWKGCGLSYWYMAQKALEAGITELRVYEDDAEFPASFHTSMPVVDGYLNDQSVDWDVFSGMISDISSEAKISQVVDYQGVTFVHLDMMIGLVFGVYRTRALEKIAQWDWNTQEKRTGAIDRYLEQDKGLRIITTEPFLCRHSANFHSSIWDAHNADSGRMISSSAQRLSRMVKEYRESQT